MERRPKIVITAPHAVCRGEEDIERHWCDVAARRMAVGIGERLKDFKVRPVVLVPDISRMELDMNRSVSRGSSFRDRVDSETKGAVFALDVHSYPEVDVPWDVDLFLLKSRVPESVGKNGTNEEIVYNLADHLMVMGLNVAVVRGRKENDIVCAAMEKGVPAVLVEFSEPAVLSGDRVLHLFVEGLKNFLRELLRGESSSVLVPVSVG